MTKTAKRPGPAAPELRGAERVSAAARTASTVADAPVESAALAASADAAIADLLTSPSAALAAALRERLLERLRDARVPEGHAQAVHLAGITGRAYQTTRRWIDGDSPGLPDLASFRMLCEGVDGDPLWLLGFTDQKRSLREAIGPSGLDKGERGTHSETLGKAGSPGSTKASTKATAKGANKSAGKDEWMDGLSSSVGQEMYGCSARRMRGDEMEPEIADGDTIFINTQVREFDGNGTYLVTCDGQELIRRVEYTVGKGLVVSCANPRYEVAVFRDAPEILAHGLRVLGRIEGVVQMRKFWRLAPGRTQGG